MFVYVYLAYNCSIWHEHDKILNTSLKFIDTFLYIITLLYPLGINSYVV